MHKFGIVFIVLCAIVLASSIPVKRNSHHKKSAKIVRFAPKTAKVVRAKLVALPVRSAHRRPAKHAARQTEAETYFKDCNLEHHVENDFEQTEYEQELEQDEAISFADAYPAEASAEAEAEAAADEAAAEQDFAEEAFEDAQQFDEADTQFEAVDAEVAHKPPMRTNKPAHKAHATGGNYFNTHFGKTHQGAIGIANSYSTGKKGASTSHATAYGHHQKQY